MQVVVALIVTTGSAFTTQAQSDGVVGEVYELVLISSKSYGDPHEDAEVAVLFTGPNDQSVEVLGFWHGGRTYGARFSPRVPGTWSYSTTARDQSNPGLHDQSGSFEVLPGQKDVSESIDFIRVSESGQYLSQENGDPIFVLSDWAAELTWKSRRQDVDRYIEVRARQGFNAINVVVSSHIYHFDSGVTNRYGQPYHPYRDASRLNPDYFSHLDYIIDKANEEGIVAILFPLWASLSEVHEHKDHPVHAWHISYEEGLHHARYIGARYAGHDVIWAVAGDNVYDTQEKRDYWNAFGREIKRATGGDQLVTVHGTGYSGTYQNFNDSEWLDFHTYTPGHFTSPEAQQWAYVGARLWYDTSPTKPLFNIESSIEGIFGSFWEISGSDTTGYRRIDDLDIRRSVYWSILSGAKVGYTYGSNGVWQWHTEEHPEGFLPLNYVLESLDRPGSRQMTVIKDLMHRLSWQDLEPRQDLLLSPNALNYIAVASSGERVVAYVPDSSAALSISVPPTITEPTAHWLNPATSDTARVEAWTEGFHQPPTPMDWLLVIESAPEPEVVEEPDTTSVLDFRVVPAPNPSRDTATLLLDSPENGSASIRLFDITGRLILSSERAVMAGSDSIRLPQLPAGMYIADFALQGVEGQVLGQKRFKLTIL